MWRDYIHMLEEEQVISKINNIIELEEVDPYPNAQRNYWERISNALSYIPPDYQIYALCVFANVVYLGGKILDDTWKFLLRELSRRYGLNANNLLNEALILSEEPQIAIHFLRANKIRGRLDTDKMLEDPTPGAIASKLLLVAKNTELSEDLRSKISEELTLLKHQYWILLTDNSLSGVSLVSELEKIQGIIQTLKLEFQVKIIVLVQVMSSDALGYVKKWLQERDAHLDVEIIYGLYLDERFKINSDECKLFKSPEILRGVRELCSWFDEEILSKDPIYGSQSKWREVSGGSLAYGFKNTGLTLVTVPNCPSNSLPLLWYSSEDRYVGPYPRVESRVSQKKSLNKDLVGELGKLKIDDIPKI